MSKTDVEMHDASDAPPDRSRSVISDAPSAPSESGAEDRPGRATSRYNHRRKGVFDAVGGRTRVREPRPPRWPGQPIKYRHAKLAPEEALFRSAGAPPRYEETDTYFAHETLPSNALPPSELVKAVHHYASHYYEVHDRAPEPRAPEGQGAKKEEAEGRDIKEDEAAESASVDVDVDVDVTRQTGRVPSNRRLIDERSMDETALLAFGILLEEAGRMVLGRNGALVLTEPAADGEGVSEHEKDGGKKDKGEGRKKKKKRSKKRKRTEADS
ncbi:hypothetical protein Sste5344_000767 [Sporothrix stenoceras]